jgi:CspA family cold shock protein
MSEGIVKFFAAQKGFGFIVPLETGPDVFVHLSDVELAGWSTLAENDRISYELFVQPNGRTKAVKLRKAEARATDGAAALEAIE